MKHFTKLLLLAILQILFYLSSYAQLSYLGSTFSSNNSNTDWNARFLKGTINMGHYGWWQDFFETPDDYSNAYYNGKYYVLMSFNRNPDAAAIARLNSVGIRLLKYVPSQTYWVEISENTTYDDIPNNVNTNDFSVLQIASFPIDWKVNSTLDIYGSNNDSINIKHKIMAWIHNGVSLLQVKNEIEADSIIVTDTMGEINAIVLYTNGAHFIELKNSPIVYYIEPLDNRIEAQASTSFINNFSNASYSNLGTSGLSGLGVQINLYEDYINPHIDFRKRITSYVPTSSIFSHGTEMAGNIVGKGIIDPRAKGVAFNCDLNIISTNNAIVTYSTMPGFNLTGWNNFYNGTINTKISSYSFVSIVGNPCGSGSPYNAFSYTYDHTSILRQNLLQIFQQVIIQGS